MKNNKEKVSFICMFMIAVIALLFCTKSSPLYPFNDWGDANIYFTIGKGIIHGQVPYRDLFDHKGPLIYMLYGIGGMISEGTFLGVWLLEILAAAVFLIYSYKTLLLLCKNKVLLLMPVFAAIIYAANHMRHGGSAEEFCIPFLAYGLYISVKWLKQQEMVSNRELLFLGITSGCVLWTKYTMLGFYIAWIIIPACIMISRKQWTKLFQTFMTIGIGVVLVTIPILLYFGVNHSLKDLVTVYFYNNIFLYAGEPLSLVQLLQRTFWNLLKAAWHNLFVFGLIGLGAIWLVVKREYLLFLQLLLCAAGLTATVLSAPTIHGYYSMCFSVFAVFGVGAMGELFKFSKMTSHRAEIITAVLSSFFMIFFVLFLGYNTEFLFVERSALPQYQFAEVINLETKPTLLNYGFLDGGFYTVSGVDPSTKYFFEANMELEKMKETQKQLIHNGAVEFVVTMNETYDWENYEQIEEAVWRYEGHPVNYYLYQLK